MQPLKLAPACLGSRTRDGSHGTREKKPHHNSREYSELEGSYYREYYGIPYNIPDYPKARIIGIRT